MNLYFENHHVDMIGLEHKYTLYAALEDDPQKRVIGYLQYTIWRKELHVDYVEVKEELRGKGIGKELYKKLYELNQEYQFIRSGYYTASGSHIRKWFEENVISESV